MVSLEVEEVTRISPKSRSPAPDSIERGVTKFTEADPER
jgi:hypothetical protein